MLDYSADRICDWRGLPTTDRPWGADVRSLSDRPLQPLAARDSGFKADIQLTKTLTWLSRLRNIQFIHMAVTVSHTNEWTISKRFKASLWKAKTPKQNPNNLNSFEMVVFVEAVSHQLTTRRPELVVILILWSPLAGLVTAKSPTLTLYELEILRQYWVQYPAWSC